MDFNELVNFALQLATWEAKCGLLPWSKKEYVIESRALSYFGCPQSHYYYYYYG